jgi:ParB family chromosome partitioning protein
VQTKQYQSETTRLEHAARLTAALSFDLTGWFTPTAENFFSRVGRTTITAALAEAKRTPAKRSWEKLKKAELAALAEREIAGTGWCSPSAPMRQHSLPSDLILLA